MKQSQSLIAEGLNDLHRVARMRARPKILHATTFEEVVAFYQPLRGSRAGADHRRPLPARRRAQSRRWLRPGRPRPPPAAQPAGADAVGRPRRGAAGPRARPVVRRQELADLARRDPRVPARRPRLRRLRLPPARPHRGRPRHATSTSCEHVLRHVPAEAVEYHARHNHFSMWLNARTMFALAARLRARNIDEFADTEAVRQYLLRALRDELSQEQEGVLADFAPGGETRRLVRISTGSIGGKGRGIAFASAYLAQQLYGREAPPLAFPDLDVAIPRTLAIGTDAYDAFLARNRISPGDLADASDEALTLRFLDGALNPGVERALAEVLPTMTGPLAVRSSSLLEDARFQPFAGIYATFMLPNNHPDPGVRVARAGTRDQGGLRLDPGLGCADRAGQRRPQPRGGADGGGGAGAGRQSLRRPLLSAGVGRRPVDQRLPDRPPAARGRDRADRARPRPHRGLGAHRVPLLPGLAGGAAAVRHPAGHAAAEPVRSSSRSTSPAARSTSSPTPPARWSPAPSTTPSTTAP